MEEEKLRNENDKILVFSRFLMDEIRPLYGERKVRCDECQHKKQLEYQRKSMEKLRV